MADARIKPPPQLRVECRPARLADASAYHRYITEFVRGGIPLYQGAQYDSESWLQCLQAHAGGDHLPDGYPPTTTYFALDDVAKGLPRCCLAGTTTHVEQASADQLWQRESGLSQGDCNGRRLERRYHPGDRRWLEMYQLVPRPRLTTTAVLATVTSDPLQG